MNKRTILIIAIVVGSILLSGPLGLSPAFLIAGVVLAFIIGGKGDRAAAQVIQQGRVTVTEIREKLRRSEPLPTPPTPSEPYRPDDPTVALQSKDEIITGHLVLADDPPPPSAEKEPEQDFIIGVTEDGRTITLDQIRSLGVGGVPGSGKTVAVVGLATQSVTKYKGNIRILVIDPHMHTGSDDALSARMAPLAPFYLNVDALPNPVSGGADLLKWVRWLDKQADDRIGGRVPKEQQQKLLIVADEFTALMDDEEISEPLTRLLLKINEQARKVGMFALLASPQWKSSRVQGTEVRNTIASFLVHNMPPNIARQLVPNAIAETSNMLRVGQAIFSSFGVIERVCVPFMTPETMRDCIMPYLPDPSVPEKINVPAAPVFGNGGGDEVREPSIAEIKSIWETYQILNQDLTYSEDSAIRALAIDVYGAEDPYGKEKVRKALKLGEETFL